MPRIRLLILLLLAGCATTDTGLVRDGVHYGVTDGPFRGRWWNYYERGRSFLDGGFYAEARADFAQALKERNEDQRWARTYGLHFTPQYFPNREFGVALYYENDYAGAVDALERSHAQQPSARAVCYLRLARQAMSQGDTTPPSLGLLPVQGGAGIARRTMDIPITATDDSYVASVIVDGRTLDVGPPAPRLNLTASVPVHPGLNEISVAAADIAGNTSEQRLTFHGDFDGPTVSFDEPVILPGAVEGVLSDAAGVRTFSIEGVAATLSPAPDGTTRFHVTLRREDLQPPLTFAASDTLENTSQGTVPLGVLQVAEAPSGFVFASAPAVVHLRNGLTALYQGSQLLALAQLPPPESASAVRFANLVDGQRYLMDEVVADLEVDAPAGVRSLALNGVPVEFLPGRQHQRVSRRVALPQAGPVEIIAVLEDTGGARQEARVTVERALTEVESLANRLSLAVLGNIWEGPNREVEAEETFVADELTRLLYEQGRFDLLSRQQLPQILTEQELSAAIGGRNGVSPLRDLVPAELMLVGMVRRDTGTIEIILQALSPETSQLMGYADVAGMAQTKDELRALVADLALRFTQEFPRVQGHIVDVRSGSTLYADLARADRIRPRMKCLVFRHGAPIVDPRTGAELGRPSEIVAEGWFDDIAESLSVVHVNSPDGAVPGVEVQDLVITK